MMRNKNIFSAILFLFLGIFLNSCAENAGQRGFAFNRRPAEINLSIKADAINDKRVAITWEQPSELDLSADIIIEVKKEGEADFHEADLSSTPRVSALSQEIEKANGVLFLPDTSYFFRARVRLDGEFSSYSAEVSAKTLSVNQSIWPKPTGLNLVSTPSKITLNWNYSTDIGFDGVSKVEIFRRSGAGSFALLKTREELEIPLKSYEDLSVVFGISYQYRLRVSYSDGSAAIDVDSVSIATPSNTQTLPAPTNIGGIPKTTKVGNSFILNSVKLTWDYSATSGANGHNGFEIEMWTSNGGSGYQFSGQDYPVTDVDLREYTVPTFSFCNGASSQAAVKFRLRSNSHQGNSSAHVFSAEFLCDDSL